MSPGCSTFMTCRMENVIPLQAENKAVFPESSPGCFCGHARSKRPFPSVINFECHSL